MRYPNIWIKGLSGKGKQEFSGKGAGVFSLEEIPMNTLICEYIGNVMTEEE